MDIYIDIIYSQVHPYNKNIVYYFLLLLFVPYIIKPIKEICIIGNTIAFIQTLKKVGMFFPISANIYPMATQRSTDESL